MNENTFGTRLRHYRNLKGISAFKLAREIGCDGFTAYKWEWEDRLPTGYFIVRLCSALEITPNQLLGWDD